MTHNFDKKTPQLALKGMPTATDLKVQLQAGAASLNLEVSESQLVQLLEYMALLVKWNAVYNLTAIRDPAQMVPNHLLDCLAVVTAFAGANRVLDVGAGGGLPGIVLAIWAREAQPAMHITLVDTVHKKTAFLSQAKAELKLDNVTIITTRVEQLQVDEPFDIITSRAFAELVDFISWSQHLLASDGHFLAMKGVAPDDEIVRMPASWVATEIRQLAVPTLGAQRHLIRIDRNGQSDRPMIAKDIAPETADTPPAGLQYGPDHVPCTRPRTL